MTIQKFRKMDLIFLTVVAIISDLLLAIFGLIGIRLFLSIAYPLIVISYIRWNKHGIILNLVIVLLHIIIFGLINQVGWPIAILHSIAIIGFSFIIFMISMTKQNEKQVGLLTYLWIYSSGFLSVFLLEWVLFNFFGYELNLIGHAFNHSINFLFGFFIILITSRQKDILINMNHFFINKEKEVNK